MKFGGRTKHFLSFWHSICNDRYVLSLLKGVKIPFINNKPPTQRQLPAELRMLVAEMQFVDKHLQELLADGFIKELPCHIADGWVSNIFLVPKKQGGFRMILNLKELNNYVQYTKFKMDHIDKVISLLRCNDVMASLDLIMAYGQIALDPHHEKFFQFTWRGKFYCYVMLPQGFSDSPRMFVHITNPLMAYLRDKLVDILIYIDDTFLRASSAEELRCNIDITKKLFSQCGLAINNKKSCLTPSTKMEFLGFVLDSVKFTISVTHLKHNSLLKLICLIHASPHKKVKIQFLAQIIGKIVSFFLACDLAKLHYCTLERFKTQMILQHKNWNFKVCLPHTCIKEIGWWFHYLKTNSVISKSLELLKPTTFIFTDASGWRYGSVWNDHKVQGLFTEKQMHLSINTKELLAIYYALGAHTPRLSGEVVHIRCNNMTAIACIKNMGSADHLRNTLTGHIFELSFKYNLKIQISYVRSADNVSDSMSRKFTSIHAEWSLADVDFRQALKLATVVLDVDLFAHMQNKKLDKYVSWKPCLNASHVDAFTLDWKYLKAYLFPPFSCISSVVKKCIDDEIEHLCGIFPLWKTKSWWPNLMRLADNKYTILKGAPKHLYLPWDRSLKHPMYQRLTLIFVNLSVNYYSSKTLTKNKRTLLHDMPGERLPLKTK